MKKNIIIIFLIILLAISFGIIMNLRRQISILNNKVTVENNKINTETDAQKFKYEYEKLNNTKTSDGESYAEVNIDIDNPIIYVTLEELVNTIDSEEETYIYISSSSCPYCRATVEILLEVAKDLNIKKIYYYDGFKQENSEQYDNLLSKLEEKGMDFINDNEQKRWGLPLVLKTKNGNIISKIRGVSYQLNEGQSRYDSLTEEQKKLVYNRYYESLKIEE